MARTPWRYMGGPPLNYPDRIDNARLWNADPRARLDEIASYCRRIQEDVGASPSLREMARQAIDHAHFAQRDIESGDIIGAVSSALSLAFIADGVALVHEFGADLLAGQNQRAGGIKGSALVSADSRDHAMWLRINQELKGVITSEHARAREIARRTACNPETVRKYIRRHS
jgi:hypothetical protein